MKIFNMSDGDITMSYPHSKTLQSLIEEALYHIRLNLAIHKSSHFPYDFLCLPFLLLINII